MSIFGTSARRDRLAAMQNAMQAQQTQAAIDARLNAGQMWGTQAIDAAQPQQIAALDQGRTQQLDAMRVGNETQRADYEHAIEGYTPYTTQGLAAWGMLGDAAGLNGEAGHDAALAAFHTGPQYDWLQSQAADQTARGASASGQLLSGNAAAAIQDRASHIADGAWNTWFGNVKGISDTGYDATNKVAALRTGQGDAAARYGAGVSDIWGTSAGRTADVYGTNARSKAGLYGQTAMAGANALSRTGDRIIDANNTAMKGGDTAEANQTNAILAALNAGASIFGSYLGGPKKSTV